MASLGSFLICMSNFSGTKNPNWTGVLLIQPLIWIFIFSPCLLISLIGKIQKLKNRRNN